MHKSVGAIMKDGDKILMIKRAIRPFGWSCPSGHIDEGETLEEAVIREFKEEINIDIKNLDLELAWKHWFKKLKII